MRSPTDLYIEQVKKQLICSKKRKAEILQQLSADVDAFASTLNEECSIDMLEEEFGTPQKAAEAVMQLESICSVKDRMDKKKPFVIITAITCAIIALGLLFYLIYCIQNKEYFANGYASETIVYDEQSIPEHIQSPPEEVRTY